MPPGCIPTSPSCHPWITPLSWNDVGDPDATFESNTVPSAASQAARPTETSPRAVGVTAKAYAVALSAVNPDTVPLVTVSPAAVNPVTGSEKVTVNGIGFVSVVSAADDSMTAVGAVVS